MKRTLKYALSAVLTAAIVLPAVAADNFPDVPDNHWAFEALQRMKKDGLLVGYPDGLFRGGRPASRYELAVAMHAVYTNLKSVTDGLDSQIKALGDKLNGVASTSDVQNLRDALTALQNEVAGMKSYGEDIANLKKMSDTFQKELQSLGVDVEAMKKDLGDISDRLKKVEARKPSVNISGTVDLVMAAGNSRDNKFGLSTDGIAEGVNTDPKQPGTVAGLTNDVAMLEEGAFTFSGTNETGPKWKGTLVVGNMLNTFGGQSKTPAFGGVLAGYGLAQGNSDIYLQDFSAKFDTSIAGLAFNAEVGRVGYKVSPYIFQRVANVSYISNGRWDDGLYRFDGGILGFNFGSAKLDLFAGKANGVTDVNGLAINGIQTGALNGGYIGGASNGTATNLQINRLLGANLNLPLTANGSLNLAYLWLDSFDTAFSKTVTANRLAVFGGDAKFNFGKIGLSGGYYKSDVQENTKNISNKDDAAFRIEATYAGAAKWGLNAGYRVIDTNYIAPGDWGRIGVAHNLTNIKGFTVGGHYDLNNAWTLTAAGEFDKGNDNGAGNAYATNTNFSTNTTINSWNANLTWHVNTNLNVMLGYEDAEFTKLFNKSNGSNSASYKWTTLGIGYGLSENAKLALQYQLSDITNDYQFTGLNKLSGGLLTGQLSIKF